MKKVHVFKPIVSFAVFLLAFFISASFGASTANAQSVSAIPCTNLAVNLKYPQTDAATGGAVTLLQNFLKAAGYLAATPTGTFGPQTRNAVSALQRQYNIPASPAGYVGPLTREKIRDISCSSTSGSNTGTGTGSGTDSTGTITGSAAQGIWVSAPGASRGERYLAGSQITVSIENPVPNPTGNPNLMSYTVDLVRGDTVFQRFGTVYATATGKKTVTYTLSPALNKDFSYRVKVTPSCTSLASVQCRQALSNEFTIIAANANSQPFVDITAPTGGSHAAGLNLPIQASIPSDKVYSLAFYLIPQSGAALSGTGSYYDSVSGGYNIGGFIPNAAVSQVSTNIPVPSDMLAGTYKLRVYLRPSNETTGSPTQWSALAYDESPTFTITSRNTGTNTGNMNTGNTSGQISLYTYPYKIVSFNGDFVPANTNIRVTFSAATGNGTINANICNSMSGTYTRNVNVITASMIGTQMACSGMTMSLETAFASMMTAGATISTEGNNIVLSRGNDRIVLSLDPLASTGTGTGTSGNTTTPTATTTNPYLRVTAPTTGFTYASTSPDILMAWQFGNLEKFRHYGFQVQLQNKLSPGQWEVVIPQTTVTATSAPVKITNDVINRFVQRSGKTKDQLKSSYFLKVFGLGYGTYPPNNTSYIDAESPTFTVTPW